VLSLSIEKKDHCSKLLKTPQMMLSIATQKKIDCLHEQAFKVCALLQEQKDYLDNVSIEDYETNRVLFDKAKSLNDRLRIEAYQVLKGLGHISVD